MVFKSKKVFFEKYFTTQISDLQYLIDYFNKNNTTKCSVLNLFYVWINTVWLSIISLHRLLNNAD